MSKFDPVIRQSAGPLLEALEAAGADVSKPKSFRCPFHNDGHPSAGISQSKKDGVWRFRCYACQQKGLDVYDVRAIVGMSGAPAMVPEPKNLHDKHVPVRSVEDWEKLAGKFTMNVVPGELRALADKLHVSVSSLQRLAIGRATCAELYLNHDKRCAWTFPMRNATGAMTGFGTRHDDGFKATMTGSHPALYIPDGWLPDVLEEVMVCEGPSDVAAALDLGFYAVGRVSCSGQVPMLVQLLKGLRVVIVGDCDEAKLRPDGTTYKPGQDGSAALANALIAAKIKCKVVLPLIGKDMRQWKIGGATRAVVEYVIKNTGDWTKTPSQPRKAVVK